MSEDSAVPTPADLAPPANPAANGAPVAPVTEPATDAPTADTAEKADGQEKSFTQAQVDSILGQRLKENKAELAALRKELEEQKATADMTASEAASFKAEQIAKEAEQVRAELAATRLEFAIKEAALEAGVPVAKTVLVAKLAEREGLVGDDGTIDSEKVKAAIASVLEVAPEFIGQPGTPAHVGTGQPVGAGPSTAATTQPEPDTLAAALEQRYGR